MWRLRRIEDTLARVCGRFQMGSHRDWRWFGRRLRGHEEDLRRLWQRFENGLRTIELVTALIIYKQGNVGLCA